MAAAATYNRRSNKDEPVRLVVKMLPAEIAAIDAWGVPASMRSRSEAVRRLIEQGLRIEAEKAQAARA